MYLINYVQEANEIWVEFTGQVKESTLEEADNFKVNGKTLSELGLDDSAIVYHRQITDALRPYLPDWFWDDVEEDMSERQFAQIKLGYDTILRSGDYTFEVFGVTNEAGGMMTPVSTRIDLIENTRPVVEEATISANDQIVLRFDEALMYGDDIDNDEISAGLAAVENFEVIINGGAAIIPTTAFLSESDHRTVTLKVQGVDFNEADSIVVNIVEDQNEQMSLEDISDNHNPIALDTIVVK
jgi:hypothetical protein